MLFDYTLMLSPLPRTENEEGPDVLRWVDRQLIRLVCFDAAYVVPLFNGCVFCSSIS